MKKYTKKKLITLAVQLAVIAALTAVDLLIKRVVTDTIPLGADVGFLEGIIGWTYVRNKGVAWSMFDGNPAMLSVFTGILIGAVFIYLALPLKRPLAYEICVPVILAGGLGNLVDRLMNGFVVDYIKTLFLDFPVYNFADCLITCGAAALVIYMIYEIIRDSKAERQKKSGEAEGE